MCPPCFPVLADEVQVITRDSDSCYKGRTAKTDNGTGHIVHVKLRLIGGDFSEGAIGFFLAGNRAGMHAAESPGDLDGAEGIHIGNFLIEKGMDVFHVALSRQTEGLLRRKNTDGGKGSGEIQGGSVYLAIGFDLVNHSVENQHFPIEMIKSSQAEIAFLQQFPARHGAVIGSHQQSINGGCLGQGVTGRESGTA